MDEQQQGSAPETIQEAISGVVAIGMVMILGFFIFLFMGWMLQSEREDHQCRDRVAHLESTVDGQLALQRAQEHPPLGYNLNSPCSRRDYLESKIR